MSDIETILSRLDKVKPTGNGEWVACCPAHDDRDPSLAVKDAGDGRVLLHCFAQCPPLAVLEAIGLTFADVMPDRLSVEGLARVPFNPRTVLLALSRNVAALGVAAADLSSGKPLSIADRDMLWEMADEFREAADYASRAKSN